MRADRTRARALAISAAAAVTLVAAATPSGAHFATVGFSQIDVGEREIEYRLYLDPYHVRNFLPLDTDDDGYVTAAEVEAARPLLTDMVSDGLTVSNGNEQGRPDVTGARLTAAGEVELAEEDLLGDFPLIEVGVRYPFSAPVTDFFVQYNLFFLRDIGDHRNFASVRSGGREAEHVFDPLNAVVSADNTVAPVASRPTWEQVYARLGWPAALLAGLVVVSVAALVGRLRSRPRRGSRADDGVVHPMA